MKTLTAYRYVTGNFESVTQPVGRGESGRTYKVGRWVRPLKGCGPLTAFVNLASAYEESWLRGRYRLFQCEVIQSRRCAVWNSGWRWGFDYLPDGTILCDQIKLTKEVR